MLRNIFLKMDIRLQNKRVVERSCYRFTHTQEMRVRRRISVCKDSFLLAYCITFKIPNKIRQIKIMTNIPN